MLASFSIALSALTADETAINVVGNNLANLNTPGFKDVVASFADLVTQSLGAGSGETQVGGGVRPPITLKQFSQGALQSTGGPLDAAIQALGDLGVADVLLGVAAQNTAAAALFRRRGFRPTLQEMALHRGDGRGEPGVSPDRGGNG